MRRKPQTVSRGHEAISKESRDADNKAADTGDPPAPKANSPLCRDKPAGGRFEYTTIMSAYEAEAANSKSCKKLLPLV